MLRVCHQGCLCFSALALSLRSVLLTSLETESGITNHENISC
jgi:hypothetical protein